MEKGERPTKYFFNLERRNYNKKTISELRMENKTIIKNKTQVLDAIEKYFKDLYTSASSATQEEYDNFIQESCLPKFSDEERDELEGLLM